MPSRKARKSIIKALSRIVAFLVALIAYASNRDWLLQRIDHYFVGYFEGICSLVIFFILIEKYGDAISEVIMGLRTLGSKHKKNRRKNKRKKY
jgi:hypothetical protein